MISLKCEACNGMMDVDEDREILTCPYCGSKNLIPISDAVKIEKIRQEAELEKKRLEYKHRWQVEQQNDNEKKRAYFLIIFIFLFVFFLLLMLRFM